MTTQPLRIHGIDIGWPEDIGFEGKLTTSKYAALTKCSQDAADRDILALVDNGILVRNPEGGRSTTYSLAPCE